MLLFVSTKAKQPTASGNSETETTCFLRLMPRLLTKTKQKSENKERPPHHIASSLVPPAPSVFGVQLTIRLFMLMIYNNVYRWVLICSAFAGQTCQGSLALLITRPWFHLVKTKNFCWQRAYSTSSPHRPEQDEHSYGGIQHLCSCGKPDPSVGAMPSRQRGGPGWSTRHRATRSDGDCCPVDFFVLFRFQYVTRSLE